MRTSGAAATAGAGFAAFVVFVYLAGGQGGDGENGQAYNPRTHQADILSGNRKSAGAGVLCFRASI